MMKSARDKGLIPAGVSFHVGSQQRSLQQWDTAIASCANIFEKLAEIGVVLTLLNIGVDFQPVTDIRQNRSPHTGKQLKTR